MNCKAIVVVGLVALLLVSGCAARTQAGSATSFNTSPGDLTSATASETAASMSRPEGEPSDSTTSATPDPVDSAGQSDTVSVPTSATEIVPTTVLESATIDDPNWPPTIISGEILEAGTTEVLLGGVRVQIPAGFNRVGQTADTVALTSSRPGSATTGSVRVHLEAATTADALALLVAEPVVVGGQFGSIVLDGFSSAAIAQKIDGSTKTWVVGVVAPGGYLTVTYAASVDDFDWFLFPQSVGSIRPGQ